MNLHQTLIQVDASFRRISLFLLCVSFLQMSAHAQRQPEKLGRGVIALRGVDMGGNGTNNWTGSGANQVFVSWRLFATDPEDVAFNVYRSANGGTEVKLNASAITTSTNYVDTTAMLTVPNTYRVKPVVNGVEGSASESWVLPANSLAEPCFTIPMPTLPDGAHYVHLAWSGDLDGDGVMDIVVDRLPTAGGTIRVEAYSGASRSQLWSVDCGPNGTGLISSGQNDGVTVYDFDGDGTCEVVTKAAAGTVFGNGAVLSGSGVYLCVLSGTTGAELSRFQVAASIGASTDSKNIGVAFFDGVRPALAVMDEAHNFNAYNVDPATKALSLRWKLVSPTSPYPHGHGIRIDDPDGDGKDEISDVGMAVDDNGTLLFKNELNHGDRYHISDIDPARPGLECFAVQQDSPSQLSYVLFDAATGEMIWRKYSPWQVDNGRGNIASMDSRFTSMQGWSASSSTIVDEFGNPASNSQPVCNMSLWWDADNLRETLNRNLVDKWNSSGTAGTTSRVLTGYNFHSATYSWRDAVPFYGDIFGDWREEIVTESSDGTTLIIFSTTKQATSRYYTLLQDPQYRCDLTVKGYMQTHHPGFYFGNNMPRPPRAPVWNGNLTWVGNAGGNVWDTSTARWKNSSTGASSSFSNGQSVLFDLSGVSSTAVTLSGTLSPSQVAVHTPKNQAYTFSGAGTLAGSMPFIKGGQGMLTLGGSHSYTGNTVVSEGSMFVNGTLSGSSVRVDSRGTLGGSGTITQAVNISEIRAGLAPGGLGSAGTLTLSGGLTEASGTVNSFDLSSSPAGSNDLVAVTGNLSISGANVLKLNLLNGTLATGSYTLFTYTGSFSGNLNSWLIRGADAFACTLANTGSAITLNVGVLRSAATITWAGGSSSAWKLATGNGWLKSGSPDNFVTGDNARFDDSGSSSSAVTLSTTVLPGSTVFDSTSNYSLSGSGAIGGTGGLTKSGTGTLTVSVANTYTGPTVINQGALALASLADGGQPSPIGASDNSAANLVINGGVLRLTDGSTSTFRNLTIGSAGGTLDIPASGSLLSLSGNIIGSGQFTKSGAGLLIINGVNTYSGGTVLQAGKTILTGSREDYSPTSPIQYGLGTGSVTLAGGTLTLSDTSQGDLDYVDSRAYWPIIVPSGAVGRLEANGRMVLGGTLTGSGDFTFFTPYVRTDVTGDWSAFSGKLNVVTDGDGGDFRIANSAGLTNSWLDLAANVFCYSRAGSGTTSIFIGALSGSAGSVINAGTGSGLGHNQPAHWRIGGRNLDTTFSGVISGTSIVTKEGTGTQTLAGANTYTGATTVSAGNLVLTGSLSGSNVTVQSGAGFGGTGSVVGNVTFQTGSKLLVVPGSGPLVITGNLTANSSVTVSPVSGTVLTAGSYTICTYTGSLSGNPSFQWSGNGFTATFNTSVANVVTMNLSADPARGPASLTWKGTISGDWDQATNNWNYTSGAVSFIDGDTVFFDETSSLKNVNLTGPRSPASTSISGASNYSFLGTGSIAGAGSLMKSGAGTLTLENAHTYSGGTYLNGGTLFTSTETAMSGIGTGPIIFQGGTLQQLENTSTYSSASYDIQVAAGQSGFLRCDSRMDLSGSLIGGGVFNVYVPWVRFKVQGDWSPFTGSIDVTTDADGGLFRLSNATGLPSASVSLAANVTLLSFLNYTHTMPVGSLSGAAGSYLAGSIPDNNSPPSGTVVTWQIGGLNLDSTFAGIIQNGNGTSQSALQKTGSGTLTLSGNSTYTGITTVSAGKLSVTGSLAATATTVATNAALGGTGTIGGVVTCNGTLAPGASAGTLTLSAGLSLASTSTLEYELGTTSDLTAVTGNLTLDGTVNMIPAAGFGAGTYTLFTYTGSLTNNILNVGSVPLGYTASVNTATAGQVKLVVALLNSAPQITSGPTASPSSVTTTSTNVAVTATDDTGEGTLTYTWSGPAAVSFSPNGTNASKNATATFSAPGSYTLTVTVSDIPGLTSENSTNVTVTATPASLSVSPPSATLEVSGSVALAASALDQFGNAIAAPVITWSTTGGSISQAGLYTATVAGGPWQASATGGGLNANSAITVNFRTFEAWVNTMFTQAQITAGESAMDQDPDHDDLTNLAEYALGSQPYVFTAQPIVSSGTTSMSITFQRPAWIGDVIYHAEAGPDITTWSDLVLEVLNPGSDPESVRATYTYPVSMPDRQFLRLRFEK